MNFNLDFTLETSEERKNFISSQDLSTLTHKELELCSNYILYGKEPNKDNTSCVDRKEVEIKTKFSSYSKKEPVSLDALLESPTFNENILNNNKNIYKKVKPTIDKEKAKLVPGMIELWEEIEKLQTILDQNLGKCPLPDNFKKLNNRQLYYLKHQLIDLRRQQYYLMDSAYPTMMSPQDKSQYFSNIVDSQLNYPVFPRGVICGENSKEFRFPYLDLGYKAKATDKELQQVIKDNKPYFNFLDREHIYQLILNYWDIKMAVEKIPDSPLNNLLWTLDFYIDKARLNEQHSLILRDKKLRTPNKLIAIHLKEELNIYHQENYISTIWNKIVDSIVAAAELNYDEWLMKDYEKAWKVCSSCQEKLLRDPRNFVRKSKSSDGLTNCCKICDKKRRGTIKW